MRVAVSAKNCAHRLPTAATKYGEITAGKMPKRASLTEKAALSAAMAMSQAQHRPTPPPKAAPWIRATVGLGQLWMRASMAAKRRASARFHSWLAVLERCIHFKSAPALKCLPSPANTMTRTLSS